MILPSLCQRFLAAAIPVASVMATVAAAQEGAAPGKGSLKAAPAGAKSAVNHSAEKVLRSSLPPSLTQSFPIGRVFKGVAIPSYTGDRLQSVMRADSVVRVDEQFLDLVNLVIQVYNDAGVPETTVSMDEAAYDLVIGELASKTPSTIEQPRFTMTGEKIIFQTDSQVAHLVGNVRLIVPDAKKFAPSLGLPAAALAAGDPEPPAKTAAPLPSASSDPPARIPVP